MTTYQPYIATHNSFWTKIKKLDKTPSKADVPRGGVVYCQTPTPTSSRPSTSASNSRPSHDKTPTAPPASQSQTSLASRATMSRSRSQSQTSLASGGGRRTAFDSNRKLSLFPGSPPTAATPIAKHNPRASEDTIMTNTSSSKSSDYNPHYHETTVVPDVPIISHEHSITRSASPTSMPFVPIESPVILPDYTIDFFLENNPPGSKGDFVVFRPRYRLRTDHTVTHDGALPSSTDPRLWESSGVVGHRYEVTTYGTLLYHGPFSESLHTRASMADYWMGRNSTINGVKDLASGRYIAHEAGEDFYPQEIPVRCRAISVDPKRMTGTWTRLWGKATYTCAPEDKAQFVPSATPLSARTPSSARLKVNVTTPDLSAPPPQQSNGPRSVRLYCSFAWLVATIIAQENVEPKDVGKYIYLDKYVSYDRGSGSGSSSGAPVWNIPLVRLRVPPGNHSKDGGWMYTERKGLEVLVG